MDKTTAAAKDKKTAKPAEKPDAKGKKADAKPKADKK